MWFRLIWMIYRSRWIIFTESVTWWSSRRGFHGVNATCLSCMKKKKATEHDLVCVWRATRREPYSLYFRLSFPKRIFFFFLYLSKYYFLCFLFFYLSFYGGSRQGPTHIFENAEKATEMSPAVLEHQSLAWKSARKLRILSTFPELGILEKTAKTPLIWRVRSGKRLCQMEYY